MIKSILSLTAIIASLGFAFLNVKPAYENLRSKQDDLKMLNDTIKQTDAIRNTIEQTKKVLGEITPAEFSRFDAFLPEKIDEIRFVNNLTKMANTRNIVLENIKVSIDRKGQGGASSESTATSKVFQKAFTLPSLEASESITSEKSKKEERYKTVTVTFSFSASYPVTKLFLGDLEKSLSLININSLSFEEYAAASSSKDAGKKTASSLYRSTIEIESYALK